MIYWRSVFLVLLGACSYGILSTFVKFAYSEGFTVGDVSGSQMFLGTCLLWILQGVKHGFPRISFLKWLSLSGVGITMGLTGILYYFSLQFIPASLAIVLLFQFTWMGIFIEGIARRQWPSREIWISVILLAIGTLLAADVSDVGMKGLSMIGLLSGLGSAISYALFIYFSGKVETEMNSVTRTSLILTGALVLTFLIYPPHFLVDGALWTGLLKWGLLLALFGAVIPTLFFAIGVPKIGSGTATILGAAELPTAVLLSAIVLQEKVNGLQWVGVLLILFGMGLPEWIRWQKVRKGAER